MVQSYIDTIYQVFLPISIPVFVGILLRRFYNMDTNALTLLALYALAPALIFHSLVHARLSWEEITITVIFSIVNLLLLWFAAIAVGKLLSLTSAELSGLTLISTFTNSVNYGIPLVLLAYGQEGLDKASIYIVFQIIIVNTVGVYFASRSQFSIKNAFINIFKLPAIYAMCVASILIVFQLQLPHALDEGFSLMAGAYAPVALVILGAQLINVPGISIKKNLDKVFWVGIGLRIVAGPLLAIVLLLLLNVKGTLFSVLLIFASMPVAVNAVILAERFNSAPQLVSKCILWTTIISLVTLPILLMLLGS